MEQKITKANSRTGYPSIDRPWKKFYTVSDEKVKIPKCTLYQNIYDRNCRSKRDIAINYYGNKISFGKLFSLVDSFYFEELLGGNFAGQTNIVDFGKGIAGHFAFSRELTKYEKDNSGHKSYLYDEYGNEIGGWIAWSNNDGIFAFQFPENMEHGIYTYELYRAGGDFYVGTSLTFSY